MNRALPCLCGLLVASLALAWYVQSSKLYINGNQASTGVIEQNGVAYVPIKDVASALKLSVQKTWRGYELSDAGGANQVNGVIGKVGDVLYNGFARFQVLKVIRGKSYTNQFTGEANRIVTPSPEAYDLVVVVCRLKNAMQKPASPSLAGGLADAVTDTEGHSYGPRTGGSADLPPGGHDLLPGASTDFALTFDVPPGAKLQDLVYEVNFIGTPDADKKKFRVSLQ